MGAGRDAQPKIRRWRRLPTAIIGLAQLSERKGRQLRRDWLNGRLCRKPKPLHARAKREISEPPILRNVRMKTDIRPAPPAKKGDLKLVRSAPLS
jgi:hypothetical protein